MWLHNRLHHWHPQLSRQTVRRVYVRANEVMAEIIVKRSFTSAAPENFSFAVISSSVRSSKILPLFRKKCITAVPPGSGRDAPAKTASSPSDFFTNHSMKMTISS